MRGEQERIPSSRHNVSFIQKVPFKILCAPQWGHWQRERERERGRREGGRKREREGRPTPTEEPGEFFSGAGTKGEHHRLATLSQDGVTDGRTSLWNTSGKLREGCLRQTAWCQRETERYREGQPRFVLNARWTVKRSDGSRSAIYCGYRGRGTSPTL